MDSGQVLYLLSDLTVKISYGATWLDSNLNALGDLTESMSEGSVITRDSTALIQGGCSFLMDSDSGFNPLTDFIQPYMVLTDPNTGVTATFNLGVYVLETPEYDNSAMPTVLTYTGYDLNYYLNFALGDSYTVPAGSDPVQAAVDVIGVAFPQASIEFTDTTSVTAHDKVWPSGASDPYNSTNSQITYLAIVNDLLAVVGYQPLWVDWNGVFQLQPYVSPGDAPPEYAFDLTSDTNIVAEPRTSTQDLFDVPNQWTFIMSNLTAAPVEGTTQYTYQDYNLNNPASIPNRGGRIPAVYFVDAADYDSLVAIGIQQIILDIRPAEQFAITDVAIPAGMAVRRHHNDRPKSPRCAASVFSGAASGRPTMEFAARRTDDMSWTLQTATQ